MTDTNTCPYAAHSPKAREWRKSKKFAQKKRLLDPDKEYIRINFVVDVDRHTQLKLIAAQNRTSITALLTAQIDDVISKHNK